MELEFRGSDDLGSLSQRVCVCRWVCGRCQERRGRGRSGPRGARMAVRGEVPSAAVRLRDHFVCDLGGSRGPFQAASTSEKRGSVVNGSDLSSEHSGSLFLEEEWRPGPSSGRARGRLLSADVGPSVPLPHWRGSAVSAKEIVSVQH